MRKDEIKNIQVGLYSHKCKQCGKDFECRAEHRYKIVRYGRIDCYDWFCSWKCIQAYREINTKIKMNSKVKKPNERDQKILDMLDKGLSLTEIGKRFGLSRGAIGKVRDKWRQ